MPYPRGKSLKQLAGEAVRYAEAYFDPTEQAETLEQVGRPVDGDYVVLVMNRFVPIEWLPDSAAVLRKFVRWSANGLDATGMNVLREYWRELDSAVKTLATAFEAG